MLTVQIIRPNERGVLYRHGQPVRWLEPGRHRLWGWGVSVEVLSLDHHLLADFAHFAHLIPTGAAEELVVPAEHHALVSVDGIPEVALVAGRYLMWQLHARVSAEVVSIHSTDDIPAAFVEHLPPDMVRQVHVGSSRRALMIQNGRLVRLLEPGAHHLWDVGPGNAVVYAEPTYDTATRELEALVTPEDGSLLVVPDGHAAIYSRDGVPTGPLPPGRYILWQHTYTVTAEIYDLTGEIDAPERVWDLLPPSMVKVIRVRPHHRAPVYVDGLYVRTLSEGRYAISIVDQEVTADHLDMREKQLSITGQEIVTRDKVSLRVNILMSYRFSDPVKLLGHSSGGIGDLLYAEAQMAARRHVSSVRVDDLLSGRGAAREAMLADITARSGEWGVTVTGLDLKDIILPGDMKAVFNQVIEAEKRAAANVITRREETAATRSLANTAKMLESNPTLMRLKEMETLKELACELGNVTIIVSPEQLQQLGLSTVTR